MKAPTAEAALKLVHSIQRLYECEEIQAPTVSFKTREIIDEAMEMAAQLRRECEFPDRKDIIQYFAKRFAKEEPELMIKRAVAMISTFPNPVLFAAYENALEDDSKPKKPKQP